MPKNRELLLTETIENLGLVGDVVKVKPGYARNYLLPLGVAVPPSPAKIAELKEARAHAQAELSALRTEREKIIEQLVDVTVEMKRSCNDQGSLYGSVTQRDISDLLMSEGYGVDVRSIRLGHPIRHIGSYTIPVQFDKDLKAEVTMLVKADRELEGFTELGEVIEREEPEAIDDDEDDRPRRRRRDGEKRGKGKGTARRT